MSKVNDGIFKVVVYIYTIYYIRKWIFDKYEYAF